MKYILVLHSAVLSSFTILTQAQDVAVPKCLKSCFDQYLGSEAPSCYFSRYLAATCLCYFSGAMDIAKSCISSTCSGTDATESQDFLSSICQGYQFNPESLTYSIPTSYPYSFSFPYSYSVSFPYTYNIAFTTPGPTKTSGSNSGATSFNTPPELSSDGLSSGGKIGIGVGVGIGVVLIAIIAGLVMLLRRSRRQASTRATVEGGSKPELDGSATLPQMYDRKDLNVRVSAVSNNGSHQWQSATDSTYAPSTGPYQLHGREQVRYEMAS